MTKNKKRRKLSLGITMNIYLIDSIVFMRYSPNETQNTFRKNIFTKYIYQNIEIWHFSFFSKFQFSNNDRHRSIAPLKCHWILPQFIYKRIEPNQRKESISKNQNFTFLTSWHFQFFWNIIYCKNYNYESIKQLKCQKNVWKCLKLINIGLVIEKTVAKKIGR